MNSKAVTYVSMDLIANKVLRHPLMKNLNYEDVIDHSVSVLKLLKVPGVYVEESCVKRIENHKSFIPKEALNLIKVEYLSDSGLYTPMTMATNTLAKQLQKLDTRMAYAKTIDLTKDYGPEIYSDPAVSSVKKEALSIIVSNEIIDNNFKYIVNNQHIITSAKDGRVLIVFEKIKTDENGIPSIPNSEAVIKAIVNYIKVQVFEVLVDMGQLSERSLTRAEQEYSWYVGKSQTEFQGFTNLDDMESFINSNITLFDIKSLHSDRFESSSDKEIIHIL